MFLPVFQFALREDLQNDLRFIPSKGEPLASGWDVRAAQHDKKDIILRPGQYFKIPLGFRSFCPPGWYYQLHPRSSSFTKRSMHNLIGIVDESWEGETLLAGQYLPDIKSLGTDLIIKFGDAIAQIIPIQRSEILIEKISNQLYDQQCKERNAQRGAGGFGSTGE